MSTAIDTDRAAERLAAAMRGMRRWGFSVVQNAHAAEQPHDQQSNRARVAACYLLGMEPIDANLATSAVKVLAEALLANARPSIDIGARRPPSLQLHPQLRRHDAASDS